VNAPFKRVRASQRRIRASEFPYPDGKWPVAVDHGETGIAGVRWRRVRPGSHLVLESLEPKAKRVLWRLLGQLDPALADALTASRPLKESLQAAGFAPLETLLPMDHPAVKALVDDYADRGARLSMVRRLAPPDMNAAPVSPTRITNGAQYDEFNR